MISCFRWSEIAALALLVAACGPEPEATTGSSSTSGSGGGESTGETVTSEMVTSDTVTGGTVAETESADSSTTGSIHDGCVDLNWSCPTDDLVCLPSSGMCVPCGAEGEAPVDGYCCSGSVVSEDGSTCEPEPQGLGCRPAGGVCGYGGASIDCCDGMPCNPDTDLCEPLRSCLDYASGGIDDDLCDPEGDASAGAVVDALADATTDESCVVTGLSSDGDDEFIELDCGGTPRTVGYRSANPHLVAGVELDAEVALTWLEFEPAPGFEPSFTLRDTEGVLLLALVDRFDDEAPLPVDISPIEIETGNTICSVFDAGGLRCAGGEAIVAKRVSVSFDVNGNFRTRILDHDTDSFGASGRTYDVIVDEATRIVCTDDSCATDLTGPYDHLRVLLVAR